MYDYIMDVADRINLTGAGIRDGRPQDEGRKHDFWRSKPKLVPVGDLAGPATRPYIPTAAGVVDGSTPRAIFAVIPAPTLPPSLGTERLPPCCE